MSKPLGGSAITIAIFEHSIFVYINDGTIDGGVLFDKSKHEGRPILDIVAQARGHLQEKLFGKQEELFTYEQQKE